MFYSFLHSWTALKIKKIDTYYVVLNNSNSFRGLNIVERHINNKKNVSFLSFALFAYICVFRKSHRSLSVSGPCPLRGLLFRNSILVCLSLVDVSVWCIMIKKSAGVISAEAGENRCAADKGHPSAIICSQSHLAGRQRGNDPFLCNATWNQCQVLKVNVLLESYLSPDVWISLQRKLVVETWQERTQWPITQWYTKILNCTFVPLHHLYI